MPAYDMYNETVDPEYKVQGLIIDEADRIRQKEIRINSEYDTKERKELLLRSDISRKHAFSKIYITIGVVSILSVSALLLQRQFPFIPELLTELFIIFMVGFCFIYVLMLYIDIGKRDRTDYNKIDFGDGLVVNPNSSSTTQSPDITTPPLNPNGTPVIPPPVCKGGKCCVSGSIFVDNQCIKEGFTGMVKPFTHIPPYRSTL